MLKCPKFIVPQYSLTNIAENLALSSPGLFKSLREFDSDTEKDLHGYRTCRYFAVLNLGVHITLFLTF